LFFKQASCNICIDFNTSILFSLIAKQMNKVNETNMTESRNSLKFRTNLLLFNYYCHKVFNVVSRSVDNYCGYK
jgi:hypothetical protein